MQGASITAPFSSDKRMTDPRQSPPATMGTMSCAVNVHSPSRTTGRMRPPSERQARWLRRAAMSSVSSSDTP